MRIITGRARGKKLVTLEGNDVRPTSDKIKESLFNILQFNIEGRVFLDLFAGSGQIGLEAISRGASKAVFVDSSKKSIAVIEQNVANCGFAPESKVVNADALMYIRHCPETFDVAFIDPPYRTGVLQEVLPYVAEAMSDTGIIVCEHPYDEEVPETLGEFKKLKDYKYGKIILTSYRRD